MSIIFSANFLTGTSFATEPAWAFDDVNSFSEFYYDGIVLVKERGIVEGYADGTYRPDDTINRAEMLKILVEASYLGQNTEFLNSYTDESCFEDVEADKWYTGYICYAKKKAWIDGYPDGTFRPGENINFVEAMKIVMNVLDLKLMHPGNFTDEDPWYRNFVESAETYNLIPMTVKDFGQLINRGEMADMIARKIKYDDGGLGEYLSERADYQVTYASIKKGIDKYKQWKGSRPCSPWPSCGITDIDNDIGDDGDFGLGEDEDEVLGITVMSFTPGLDKISFVFDYSFNLAESEIFHIECLEEGKAKSFAKMLDTYLEEVEIKNLKKNTTYNCWVAIKDGDQLSFQTEIYSVKTLSAAEKVEIIESSATPTEITLRVKSMNLKSGEKYFAECIGPGGSNDFYPTASSTSTTLVVKKGSSSNVKVLPDSNYSCYVAVTGVDGVNRYFSDKVNIYTPEPPLVISEFTVGTDNISFKIDEVPLEADEYFYAYCWKVSTLGSWEDYPDESSDDRNFYIDGLKQNTEYECIVSILGSADPDYGSSKVLGFKTKSDGSQLNLTLAYAGVDKDGVYIVLGVDPVGLSSYQGISDQYAFLCEESDVSSPDGVTEDSLEESELLRLNKEDTVYACDVGISTYTGYVLYKSETVYLRTPKFL